MPKCKICKEKFEAKYFLQKTCFNSSCVYEWSKQVKQKEWKKEKKQIKSKLKTHSKHLGELQNVFNKYIRLRDKGKPCISCGSPLSGKYDAGHYRSVGSCPELRFEEKNVHGQCVHCNRHLHGNLIEYRKGLVQKYGVDTVEWLEKSHETLKLTIPEINELKAKYKELIKIENK